MADTLESIFQATSLGATELDDGEHTLVTTDANTSFVIKDMHVNSTSHLTNTHLELNGFNVSGITSNATGSLIIPPNSTLKIKTTDYPFSFVENFTWISNSNSAGFEISYTDTFGNSVGTSVAHMGSGHLQRQNDVISNVYYAANNGGNGYLYYHTNDTNSVQRAYAWRLSDDNVISIRNESYKPFGLHNNKLYYFEGSEFRVLDLSVNPVGPTFSAFTISGNYNSGTNYYNPRPTSSYPRARASHGFMWFIVNNSNNNIIYATKLEGTNAGQFYKFTFSNNMSLSSYRDFVVSPDLSDDSLYIYRLSTTGEIYQHKFNGWTALQAVNSTSRADYTPDVNNTITTPVGNVQNNSMASVQFGYLLNGGMTYHSNGYNLIELDNTGTVTKTTAASAVSFDGYGHSSPSNGFFKNQRILSQSESTALSLTASTFGIQLLGVKSTT